VAKAIAAGLERADAGFGYCSAACGADILFIEQMLKRRAEVHVILPFAQQDFIETSVAFAGAHWVKRFHAALGRATSVTRALHERYLGDDILFGYAASLTQGAALLRAAQLETGVLQLAVLDPQDRERTGGTQSAVAAWNRLGLPAHSIDLRELRGDGPSVAATDPVTSPAAARRELKTMLFADMVGFSRLQEQDTPAFLVHFLGEIARVIAGAANAPAFLNTWGDGLFMVFDDPAAAAEFALRLRDAVRATDWRQHGLPEDTSIRIGMHTGPVFPAMDPIIGRRNFFGAHVNRAARIEPVTAPGAIYISEQMAALLAAAGAREFACDYLGSMALAKHFGEGVLYRLRRAHEGE
jgi:class 3 adenylate cyclase